MSIADNLERIRRRIEEACARTGRDPAEVTLVAVSKRHGEAAIREAYATGQRDFGENYVAELVDKAAAVADLEAIRWHFIGHLQRNKAKDIAQLGCMVQCIDSVRIAQALDRRAAAAGRVIDVLVQVNVDADLEVSVLPDVLAPLLEGIAGLSALRLVGLMAIPAHTDDPQDARGAFNTLRQLVDLHGLRVCSMGMTHDLDVAVEQGATMVRVGTAIFGPRPDAPG